MSKPPPLPPRRSFNMGLNFNNGSPQPPSASGPPSVKRNLTLDIGKSSPTSPSSSARSRPPALFTFPIARNSNNEFRNNGSPQPLPLSASKKNLTLDIGTSSPTSPAGSARSRSPANLSFPIPQNSTNEYHNLHAETDSKFHEIMNCTGKIIIRGNMYTTAIEDMQELGVLGAGTCGHVVKMRHLPSGEILAVKQMRRSGNRDENKRIIMDLEVVLKSHDCPYIVQCLGCFVTDSDVWICMELMTTCMDKLLKNLKHALPEYIVGKVAAATVRALHYLKETHGVIHRDVKPSNILLDDRGNVKLCDFGISGRLVDSKAKTRTAGCTAYMAPERIDPPDPSRPNYDIRADVWSLGITLVELATGKFPYGDCTTEFEVMTRILENAPPKLPSNRNYSPEFHAFVEQCLVKDYKLRPKYHKLLQHSFIRISDAKPIDIRTWYNIVCGSSTPNTILASRQHLHLQSPSAASLNNFQLPSSGSSSVGRHTSRLRSSPSPSSTSSLMSIVTPNVPHRPHRLNSAESSTPSLGPTTHHWI